MPYQVIIQYVPDSVTDERINIGVSVLADGKAVTHFLTDWTRVRNFANRDVSFLKDLVHESKKWDECTVRRLSKCWLGTIQFSEPMGTLLPPEEALLDGLRRYLFERTIETRGYRDKCTLVTSVRKNVRSVLGQFWGAKGKALLKCKEVAIAAGEPSPYQFDIPVANGRPYFAVQGVSFEEQSARQRNLEHSLAYPERKKTNSRFSNWRCRGSTVACSPRGHVFEGDN